MATVILHQTMPSHDNKALHPFFTKAAVPDEPARPALDDPKGWSSLYTSHDIVSSWSVFETTLLPYGRIVSQALTASLLNQGRREEVDHQRMTASNASHQMDCRRQRRRTEKQQKPTTCHKSMARMTALRSIQIRARVGASDER